MKEISIQELKLISLGILDAVHQFCVDNDIKYSLAYGTLIGAVRHKGFIPWDDDIDIMMPREDYLKFIKTFNKEEKGQYRVVDVSVDGKYPYAFAKVEDLRTIKNELGYDKIGVCIDVFPLDNFPDNDKDADKYFVAYDKLRKIPYVRYEKYQWKKDWNWFKNISFYVVKLLLFFCSLKPLIKIRDRIAQRYNKIKTDKMFSFVGGSYGRREIVPSYIFDNFVTLDFEGRSFKAIANYDEVLTILYGDYMQLPPEEKRVTHHTFSAYWKE